MVLLVSRFSMIFQTNIRITQPSLQPNLPVLGIGPLPPHIGFYLEIIEKRNFLRLYFNETLRAVHVLYIVHEIEGKSFTNLFVVTVSSENNSNSFQHWPWIVPPDETIEIRYRYDKYGVYNIYIGKHGSFRKITV